MSFQTKKNILQLEEHDLEKMNEKMVSLLPKHSRQGSGTFYYEPDGTMVPTMGSGEPVWHRQEKYGIVRITFDLDPFSDLGMDTIQILNPKGGGIGIQVGIRTMKDRPFTVIADQIHSLECGERSRSKTVIANTIRQLDVASPGNYIACSTIGDQWSHYSRNEEWKSEYGKRYDEWTEHGESSPLYHLFQQQHQKELILFCS